MVTTRQPHGVRAQASATPGVTLSEPPLDAARGDLELVERPTAQGLYDPRAEHDACGVGFVVHMKGHRSHDLVRKAMQVLMNLEHRGACGCEANTGDGAGILVQMPDTLLRKVVSFPLPAAGDTERVSSFCRAKGAIETRSSGSLRASSTRRGRRSSAGARFHMTTD